MARRKPKSCPADGCRDLLGWQKDQDGFWDRGALHWLRKVSCFDQGAGVDAQPPNAILYSDMICLWIAFNAWASYVIKDPDESQHDYLLVDAAGRDGCLNKRFEDLLHDERKFKCTAERFRSLWSVFKTTKLCVLGLPLWGPESSRDDYRAKCLGEDGLTERDYAPGCFKIHQKCPGNPARYSPNSVPLDWAHTLAAIYKVRCSLFHGKKDPKNILHDKFVRPAVFLLWKIWGEIACERSGIARREGRHDL